MIEEKQFESFKQNMHGRTDQSFYSTISRNNLMLYKSKKVIKTSKVNLFASAMKERVQLYSSLYVACQSLNADLQDFFRHENHDYPPSLSDFGNIRKPTAKSDFLKCLPYSTNNYHEAPVVDSYVIDGAAFVHMHPPRSSKTYGDYCSQEIGGKVRALSSKVKRVDVVFDVYLPQSREGETRESRHKNKVRVNISKDTHIYQKFNEIMAVNENKTELFNLKHLQRISTKMKQQW